MLPAGFVAKIDVADEGRRARRKPSPCPGPRRSWTSVSTAPATVLTRETLDIMPSAATAPCRSWRRRRASRPQIRHRRRQHDQSAACSARSGRTNQPWQQIEGCWSAPRRTRPQGGIYWDYNMVEEAKVGTFGSPAEIGTRGIAHQRHLEVRRQHVPRQRVLRVSERLAAEQQHRRRPAAQGITRRRRARFAHRRVRRSRRPHRPQQALVLRRRAAPGADGEHAGVLPAERRGVLRPDHQIFNTQKLSWQINPSNQLDRRVPHLRPQTTHGQRQRA